MILTLDCETRGLDATGNKLVMASTCDDTFRTKTFMTKTDTWNHILDLATKLTSQKQCLHVYMHNANYDFWNIVPRDNLRPFKWYSHNPFLATYKTRLCKITFSDSMSIFRMSLDSLGKIIGEQKGVLHLKLKNDTGQLTLDDIDQIRQYNKQDTIILMKALLLLKDKISEKKIKYMKTIYQIAIQYMLNHMKGRNYNFLFYNENRNQLHWPKHKYLIHEAYRGGRCEAFKTGHHNNITYIDVNNLYGYAAMNMRFPNLRTEQMLINPLATIKQSDLLNSIGIHQCLVYNHSDNLGLLPVRTPVFAYYPGQETYLLGTWTDIELKLAVENGYEIKHIHKSVIWDDAPVNPYKEYIPYLYNKRFENNDPFNKYLYKSIMVGGFGKLAQKRLSQTMFIDSVEELDRYIENNVKALYGVSDTEYMYQYEPDNQLDKPKSYYAPIIPCLVNAWSRCHMYKQFQKVPYNRLIYTDTDSIMLNGNDTSMFDVGSDIGQFKIEHTATDALVWGPKAIRVDNQYRLSRIPKSAIQPELFEKGRVEYQDMVRFAHNVDIASIGQFSNQTRNLKAQKALYCETKDKFKAIDYHEDTTITNRKPFLLYLRKV